MTNPSAAERLKEEIGTLTNPDEKQGLKILDRYPTLVTQLLDANFLYVPDFLKRMGQVMRHTQSERAVIKMAEVALKYRQSHPQGSVNTSEHLACCLEEIAYYTKSAKSVISSANLIATASRGVGAVDITDRVTDYATEHTPEQEYKKTRVARPRVRFDNNARKLFPEYSSN